MTWKVIHWSVNFLFWIALALVLASSIVSNRRNATVHANGKVRVRSAVVRIWRGYMSRFGCVSSQLGSCDTALGSL